MVAEKGEIIPQQTGYHGYHYKVLIFIGASKDGDCRQFFTMLSSARLVQLAQSPLKCKSNLQVYTMSPTWQRHKFIKCKFQRFSSYLWTANHKILTAEFQFELLFFKRNRQWHIPRSLYILVLCNTPFSFWGTHNAWRSKGKIFVTWLGLNP